MVRVGPITRIKWLNDNNNICNLTHECAHQDLDGCSDNSGYITTSCRE